MIDKLKEIFENEDINNETCLKNLSMDSINTLSIYLLFKNDNIDIDFDQIKQFKKIGDIINYYESKK